ncbi:hypothetical protein [Dyadobacter helix]|uniref:hypothetical protein n=1 Tax=Dyadobacter helix TaxID=2822344 RepID=UPI001BFCD5DC|nr:hypothetical protein [Dyadobacter sp. CECT 9275]
MAVRLYKSVPILRAVANAVSKEGISPSAPNSRAIRETFVATSFICSTMVPAFVGTEASSDFNLSNSSAMGWVLSLTESGPSH